MAIYMVFVRSSTFTDLEMSTDRAYSTTRFDHTAHRLMKSTNRGIMPCFYSIEYRSVCIE